MSIKPPGRGSPPNSPSVKKLRGEESSSSTSRAASSVFSSMEDEKQSDHPPSRSGGGGGGSYKAKRVRTSSEEAEDYQKSEGHSLRKIQSKSHFNGGKHSFSGGQKQLSHSRFSSKSRFATPDFSPINLEADPASLTRDREVAFASCEGNGEGLLQIPLRADLIYETPFGLGEATIYAVSSDQKIETDFPHVLAGCLNNKLSDKGRARAIEHALDSMGIEKDFSALIEFRKEDGKSEVYAVARNSSARIIRMDLEKADQLNDLNSTIEIEATTDDVFLIVSSEIKKIATLKEIIFETPSKYSAKQTAEHLLKVAYKSGVVERASVMAIRPPKNKSISSIRSTASHHRKSMIERALKSTQQTLASHFKTEHGKEVSQASLLEKAYHQRTNLGISHDPTKRMLIQRQLDYGLALSGFLKEKRGLPQVLAFFHEGGKENFGNKNFKQVEKALTAEEKRRFKQEVEKGKTISTAFQAALQEDKAGQKNRALSRMKDQCENALEAEELYGTLDQQVADILRTERGAIKNSNLSEDEKTARLTYLDKVETSSDTILSKSYYDTFGFVLEPEVF
ncbi:MAG: hypothetical protein S4CHLAM45_02890 [Chlamydiales bacterium]|nr:hypothetical protein [Chlamydiales bacterium]MCH9619147.1 hypothetical protein [Chlamydiales bacterium]MCH9622409.1 hypothetical protein [Chlamydiales bacterium]